MKDSLRKYQLQQDNNFILWKTYVLKHIGMPISLFLTGGTLLLLISGRNNTTMLLSIAIFCIGIFVSFLVLITALVRTFRHKSHDLVLDSQWADDEDYDNLQLSLKDFPELSDFVSMYFMKINENDKTPRLTKYGIKMINERHLHLVDNNDAITKAKKVETIMVNVVDICSKNGTKEVKL